MKLRLALLLAAALTLTSRASTTSDITALLTAQTAAWNRGDIDGFMQAYLESDLLRFASGASVTRGWRATRDGYKQRYPDRATMGTLEFSELEITELSP